MLDPNVAAPATLQFPAVVEVLPGHDPGDSFVSRTSDHPPAFRAR